MPPVGSLGLRKSADGLAALYQGDCLKVLPSLPAQSAHCCVTSPPYYGLRDYGVAGQLGLEAVPEEYVARLVEVFRQVRRVLRDDGTLWLNLGDSYAARATSSYGDRGGRGSNGRKVKVRLPPGLKHKDLIGIPWMVAFALRSDGWYLRCDVVWSKPNTNPENVPDRPTRSHEFIFLLSASPRYYYDTEAVKEPDSGKRSGNGFVRPHRISGSLSKGSPREWLPGKGRRRRSVWEVSSVKRFRGAHFATFPPALVEPCVLAGCPEGGTVLDPFAGACTTGLVAMQHGRKFLGVELSPAYCEMGWGRLTGP